MTQVLTGIDAEIIGREPIATQKKELYFTQKSGFVMANNGNVERISHAKAQKFLEKNAPDKSIYKMDLGLLYR